MTDINQHKLDPKIEQMLLHCNLLWTRTNYLYTKWATTHHLSFGELIVLMALTGPLRSLPPQASSLNSDISEKKSGIAISAQTCSSSFQVMSDAEQAAAPNMEHMAHNCPENSINIQIPPLTQRAIVEEWGLSKQTVNAVITRFRERHLITVRTSPKDQRSKLIELTPQGRTWAVQILQPLFELEHQTVAAITPEEFQQMLKIQEKFNEALAHAMSHEKQTGTTTSFEF